MGAGSSLRALLEGTFLEMCMASLPSNLVLFDGHCGLCDASVNWLLAHDPHEKLCFAPLQGETAERVRAVASLPRDVDSVIFVEAADRVSWRSTAVVRICRVLPWPWRLLSFFWWVPWPLRDVAYRSIAVIRYRVWGRHDACRLPTGDEARRFLP